MPHIRQLTHQQGGALMMGQPPDIRHQPPQLLTALRLLAGIAIPDQRQHRVVDDLRPEPAELVDAAVMRHPVQPRP